VAERIRTAVECLGIRHEASSAGIVTISVGVAATRAGQDSDPAMLVGAADRALYAAKRKAGIAYALQTSMSMSRTSLNYASNEANRRRPQTAQWSPYPLPQAHATGSGLFAAR